MKHLSVYLPELSTKKYIFVKPCHLLINEAFTGTEQQSNITYLVPNLDIKSVAPSKLQRRKAAR